jgi:hypothetical protein
MLNRLDIKKTSKIDADEMPLVELSLDKMTMCPFFNSPYTPYTEEEESWLTKQFQLMSDAYRSVPMGKNHRFLSGHLRSEFQPIQWPVL